MNHYDVLAHVMLSPAAVEAWGAACRQVCGGLAERGIVPAAAQLDETAEVADDGSLVIRGQIGTMELRLWVPSGHWAWTASAVQ